MPIDWIVVSGALLSGLLGSAHCVLMCSGIATSINAGQARPSFWMALQPNLGRVAGYTLAGAAVGALGGGLLQLARAPELALTLRALVGVVLIIVALRMLDTRGRLGYLRSPGGMFWHWLQPLQKQLVPADTVPKRLALGLLWGWLPCGLSTTLLTAAWLQGNAWHGALTMAAFGAGTCVVMVPLTWAGARVAQGLQRGRGKQLAALGLLLLGVLTLAAPWLAQAPAVHGVLEALGCRTLPVAA